MTAASWAAAPTSVWLSYSYWGFLEACPHMCGSVVSQRFGKSLDMEFRASHFWISTSWDSALMLEAMKIGTPPSAVFFCQCQLPESACSVSSRNWFFCFCFHPEFIVVTCQRLRLLGAFWAIWIIFEPLIKLEEVGLWKGTLLFQLYSCTTGQLFFDLVTVHYSSLSE